MNKYSGSKLALTALTISLSLVLVVFIYKSQKFSTISTDKTIHPTQLIEYWYSDEQVFNGNLLFQANCSGCHKSDASGTKEWRKRDENGIIPPPPLNGNAHTWHHSLAVLTRTIRDGGSKWGGTMPPFSSILKEQQILEIIAWIQSNWSDEVYVEWEKINSRNSK